MFPNAAEGTSQVLNERRIRGSVSFQSLHDVYELFLTMKADIVHTKIAAGLSHGLAISYSSHSYLNGSKGGNNSAYLAPTLVGTGNNSSGQLGSQINPKYKGQESIDGFEKIMLLSSREEYYPIQVCCGFSFSMVLAIEAKALQWLDSIQEQFEKNKDKSEFIGMHSDKIKEALSKTRIFFAGSIPTFPDEGMTAQDQNKPELSSALVKKMTHKESLRPISHAETNQHTGPLLTTRNTFEQPKLDAKGMVTYANQESNENEPLLFDTEDHIYGEEEEEEQDEQASEQSDDEETKKKLNRDLLIAQEQVLLNQYLTMFF